MKFITAKEMRKRQRVSKREEEISHRLRLAQDNEYKPKSIKIKTAGSPLSKKLQKRLTGDGYKIKARFARVRCNEYNNIIKRWVYTISW